MNLRNAPGLTMQAVTHVEDRPPSILVVKAFVEPPISVLKTTAIGELQERRGVAHLNRKGICVTVKLLRLSVCL
jgi:hypothetical protein